MEAQNLNKEFEAALLRVMALEKMDCSVVLSLIKELKNQMIQLQSRKIYAIKEAVAAHNGPEISTLPLPEEKTKIKTEIIELTNAKLNHQLVRESLQKAAFNTQMQTAVHEYLEELDVDKDIEASSNMQQLLEHYSNNLYTSKNLLSLLAKKEQLDADSLSSRLKYLELLRNIKQKWEVFQGKAVPLAETDQDMLQLRSRIEAREAKLKIMIFMLQGLISTSGTLWGADDYYVQVMMLCDCIQSDASKGEMDKILDSISKLRAVKERKAALRERSSVVGKPVLYFTKSSSKKKISL